MGNASSSLVEKHGRGEGEMRCATQARDGMGWEAHICEERDRRCIYAVVDHDGSNAEDSNALLFFGTDSLILGHSIPHYTFLDTIPFLFKVIIHAHQHGFLFLVTHHLVATFWWRYMFSTFMDCFFFLYTF